MSKMKYHGWEDAYEAVTDELHDIKEAADNLITLWDLGASDAEIENSLYRLRMVLKQNNSENFV
jgi:hypothetical protein